LDPTLGGSPGPVRAGRRSGGQAGTWGTKGAGQGVAKWPRPRCEPGDRFALAAAATARESGAAARSSVDVALRYVPAFSGFSSSLHNAENPEKRETPQEQASGRTFPNVMGVSSNTVGRGAKGGGGQRQGRVYPPAARTRGRRTSISPRTVGLRPNCVSTRSSILRLPPQLTS
jgi:hypothetical protein